MIISATRRADLPAHYAQWFLNRIDAGWCAVPNPFNSRQVARISLTPENVSALVFWTRDPRPLMRHLPALDSRGYRYVFQFTLVEYPVNMHPGMPPLPLRLDVFKNLAGTLGPERVLWRYDPVVLTSATDTDFHIRSFEHLSRELAGFTRRVTVSVMEPYKKIRKRMELAKAHLLVPDEKSLASMFTSMAAMAREAGMEPVSCADEAALQGFGFTPGACVDAGFLSGLFGLDIPDAKDPSQRDACRCAPSRDIGMYDACPAGCVYCYATQNFERSRQANARHDPLSPSLIGNHMPGDAQHTLPM
ncbi:MAG: DUF1848 domain-containing protein [Desulfovibrio sp.]|nr:DUF1848 domain-containing protein [Desulfovibrio sp.]MBI4958807.1 DUF1848 domain-containing protein [Desulfovibrio sp.]